jgi:hypothetical protein
MFPMLMAILLLLRIFDVYITYLVTAFILS